MLLARIGKASVAGLSPEEKQIPSGIGNSKEGRFLQRSDAQTQESTYLLCLSFPR